MLVTMRIKQPDKTIFTIYLFKSHGRCDTLNDGHNSLAKRKNRGYQKNNRKLIIDGQKMQRPKRKRVIIQAMVHDSIHRKINKLNKQHK